MLLNGGAVSRHPQRIREDRYCFIEKASRVLILYEAEDRATGPWPSNDKGAKISYLT
jgi:hypothetical protein